MCFRTRKCVTYIGQTLSRNGLSKGPIADAVVRMHLPTNVSHLRSFLSSVQFYNNNDFNESKRMLTKDTVLAHYDPTCPVGISCDASDIGIGAVLFQTL